MGQLPDYFLDTCFTVCPLTWWKRSSP